MMGTPTQRHCPLVGCWRTHWPVVMGFYVAIADPEASHHTHPRPQPRQLLRVAVPPALGAGPLLDPRPHLWWLGPLQFGVRRDGLPAHAATSGAVSRGVLIGFSDSDRALRPSAPRGVPPSLRGPLRPWRGPASTRVSPGGRARESLRLCRST